MKKIFLFIAILLIFNSCEEVIDLDLPTEAPRLVIDSALTRIFDMNDVTTPTDSLFVQLSLTRSFFSETDVPVSDAAVRISALNSGQFVDLEHTNNGSYSINGNLQIDPTESYKLEVTYQGEVYEATEQLQTSTPIIDVQQIKNPGGFDEEDFIIDVTFQDKPNKINYLVFDFGGGDIFSIDDEFIEEGVEFTFQNNFDKDASRDKVVKLIGADQRFAIYVDDISTITDGGGGPFGVTPFKVRGNIVNTTNPDNFALGYFRVNEIYQKSFSLEDSPEFFD